MRPGTTESIFCGLSAFPLSPLSAGAIDEVAFIRLIERLVVAGVDSICVLGSTGNYAYLTPQQRQRIVQLGIEHAAGIPVIAGVGALTTAAVLAHAEAAQQAGAAGLLLPPMSYQPLRDDEVFSLFQAVSDAVDIPLCVYDNPTTTHFTFSDGLLGRIAQLPGVGSIKIPGVPDEPATAAQRVSRLRTRIPAHVTIGVSGDAYGAKGLSAGCDTWYSAIGGVLPQSMLAIARAAQAGDMDYANKLSDQFDPVWQLCARYGGSLRVIAAIAEQFGLVQRPCLPPPLQGLAETDRLELDALLDELSLR